LENLGTYQGVVTRKTAANSGNPAGNSLPKKVEYHENIRHRNSESKSQKKSSRFLISADFLHRFLYFRPGLGAEVQGLRSVGAL
jgi:hypothetical protein